MSHAIPLPPRPNLEQYKKQAKDLVKTRDFPKLADAQFFLAREHGFESWPKFAKHIEELRRKNSPDAQFEAAADAIVSGDIATLARLLKENPELSRQRSSRSHRSTLLHYVSANGIEDFRQRTPANIVAITTLLLDAGADVNAESDAYRGHSTTLGLAATSVHPAQAGVQIALMELLLERGAIFEPLAVRDCLANGRPEAAEFLAARGAHLTFAAAAGIGRLELLQENATKQEIETGFLWACEYGRKDVVEYLLERGVDPNAVDGRRMNGLHCAAVGGHLDVVRLLLARNFPLETLNAYGGTALGAALWASVNAPRLDHLRIIETLVDAGAQVDERWLTGKRPEIEAALRRPGTLSFD